MSSNTVTYQSILLKLSGEALGGDGRGGLTVDVLAELAEQIEAVLQTGTQVAIVLGGGNILRGRDVGTHFSQFVLRRTTADQIGMLATVINALAFRDALAARKLRACVMTPSAIDGMSETFSAETGRHVMSNHEVLICAGGTGNPLFTTDTTACLRAIELGTDVVLKATLVDGFYDSDPTLNSSARLFEKITYQDVISRELKLMDLTSILLCRDHGMPLVVFNISNKRALMKIVNGENVGTLVYAHEGGSQP